MIASFLGIPLRERRRHPANGRSLADRLIPGPGKHTIPLEEATQPASRPMIHLILNAVSTSPFLFSFLSEQPSRTLVISTPFSKISRAWPRSRRSPELKSYQVSCRCVPVMRGSIPIPATRVALFRLKGNLKYLLPPSLHRFLSLNEVYYNSSSCCCCRGRTEGARNIFYIFSHLSANMPDQSLIPTYSSVEDGHGRGYATIYTSNNILSDSKNANFYTAG